MTVVGSATVELRGDSSHFSRQMNRALGTFNRVGQRMRGIGRRLTFSLTAPLLAVGGASAKVATTFEREMSRVEGLVGIASDQVNRWGQDILRMAPRLGTAPQELARGLFFVTSAGFRGAEAMDVLEQAAKASAAGLGAVATIADAVTSAVNAYGAENLSAGQATDVLTAAVREGKLEAESLAPVLGNLLPTASAMGISFQQVAGILAVFSRTGADAASAATSLQRLMSTLQRNTGPAVEMLEDAGLSLATLRDIARGPQGLIGVMRLLEETFEDNEAALAQLFPEQRAFRGVMNALSQDADTVDSVLRGVADSAGVAETAFGVAADTASFRFNSALAELQATGIRIGQRMLPTLVRLVSELSDRLAGVSPATLDLGVQLAAVAAVVGPALVGLGIMVSTLSTLAGLLNPVTAVLAAVAAGALAIRQNWFGIGDVVARTFDVVVTGATEAFRVVDRISRPVVNAVIGHFRFLGSVAKIVWEEFVRDVAVDAFETMRDTAARVIPQIIRSLAAVGQGSLEFFSGLIERVTSIFQDDDVREEGAEAGRNLGQRISEAAVEAFGTDYVAGFVDFVGEGADAALAAINRKLAELRALAERTFGGGSVLGGQAFGRGPTTGFFGLGEDGGLAGEERAGRERFALRIPEGLREQVSVLTEETQRLGQVGMAAAQQFSRSFEEAFVGVVTGSQGLLEAFRNLATGIIAEIARILARLVALKITLAALGIDTGGLGAAELLGLGDIAGLQHGGIAIAGRAHIVGEAGPELFVPGRTGRVVPNRALAAAGARSGGPGAGQVASAILSRLGPPPRPQSPREVRFDAWWRVAFASLARDHEERS
ncbi:MAG: phage tail tape measure protein [Longimicrobiales bacterium]